MDVSERCQDLPGITDEVKQTWQRRREDYSAGGVAYQRGAGGEVEIALIATRGGTRWQLPKGTCESGETAEQTALREVLEEVGLTTASETFLQTIDYWYWDTYRKERAELVHKRVDFFLLRVIGGDLCGDSYEVDSAGWFTAEQALTLLTFPGEQETVQMAMERVGELVGGCVG